MLPKGIEYHRINGESYEVALFEEEVITYQSSLYPPTDNVLAAPLDKIVLQAHALNEDFQPAGETYACVFSDSEPESQFAKDCALDELERAMQLLAG